MEDESNNTNSQPNEAYAQWANLADDVRPVGVRDEQDYQEYLAEKTAKAAETLQKDRAMVGEISKIENRSTREIFTACLPLFYRNKNPRFQEPVEWRHEILDAMLEYSRGGGDNGSFSQYMMDLGTQFYKAGEDHRGHIYQRLGAGKMDSLGRPDEFALPKGYFAQMEVGNRIEKDMEEHAHTRYAINDYWCYEMYKDRLKQGEEIIQELQDVE